MKTKFQLAFCLILELCFYSLGYGNLNPNKLYEPSQILNRHDTISVVFGSDSIYYPFGKFSTPLALSESMGSRVTMLRASTKKKPKTSNQYIFVLGRDTIKVFHGDRVGRYCAEIVEAKIIQPGFKFRNGIEVGIQKSTVFNEYFDTINEKEIKEYNVLELISALDGIWHYYTFGDDMLKKIEIKSDYTWEK